MSPKVKDTIRPPAVAGLFYPADQNELLESIRSSFTHRLGPGRLPKNLEEHATHESKEIGSRKIECILVPHAGYIYSGPVAAHSYMVADDFFQSLENKGKTVVIILGPNHYGLGSGVAVSPDDYWRTPLGLIEVDSNLAKTLAKNSNIIDLDSLAHSREHSIEVQLPFLQAVCRPKTIRFLPISLMMQDRLTAMEVGNELLEIINSSDDSFLVVGSSDLTHYEPHLKASSNDLKLLSTVESMDEMSFYSTVERLNVSACGYGAIAAVMHVAKKLGKTKGTLLKYATSGDVTGDKSSVVGYSSVHFN